MNKKLCILVLEDGKYFEGSSWGADGEVFGEVVFNTSMTGYQEVLTDPSYSNQIATMTYPHIGNYGVNDEDTESVKIHVSGFIVKEASSTYSNWRSKDSLSEYLKINGIVGIQGIDTRALVKHIRLAGAMRGAISTQEKNPQALLKKVQEWPSLVGRDLVQYVTTDKPYTEKGDGSKRKNSVNRKLLEPSPLIEKSIYKVAVFDFGIKNNILNCLRQAGCKLTVFPAQTSYKEILNAEYDGLFLSNGPGDPAAVKYAIENVKNLLGKLPIFGICLGHQILALALGAKTYKLKFGHRGANQPVKNLAKGTVEITAQNHGFAVKANDWLEARPARQCQISQLALAGGGERREKSGTVPWPIERGQSPKTNGQIFITHMNLNDKTIEGISCPGLKAFSVQYHPESSPGPHDSRYLFDDFVELMKGGTQS